MEMLVVITIVALLSGLGIGAYRSAQRTYSLAAAASEIQTIIRSARNTSVAAGVPTRVVIDPVARTAHAYSYESLGEWSFDPGTDTAGSAPGRIGLALGPGRQVDAGDLARYGVRDGLAVECWVRHGLAPQVKPPLREVAKRSEKRIRLTSVIEQAEAAAAAPAFPIVAKEGAFSLGLTPSAGLEASIGGFVARTAPAVVPPSRWVFVTLRFDGSGLEVAADGIARALAPVGGRALPTGTVAGPPGAVPATSTPLRIGSSGPGFPGAIDEVRLRGAVEPVIYTWPEGLTVLGWKKDIRFDRRGRLDARFHDEPVRIVLLEPQDSSGSSRTVLHIDYSKTFEEWQASQLGTPDDGGQEDDARGGGRLRLTTPRREAPPEARQTRAEVERRIEERHRGSAKIVIEVDRLGGVR